MTNKILIYLLVLLPLIFAGLFALWQAYKHYQGIVTKINSKVPDKKKSIPYFLIILTFGSLFSIWQLLTPFKKTFEEYGEDKSWWEIAVLTWRSHYFLNYIGIIILVFLLIIISTIFLFIK